MNWLGHLWRHGHAATHEPGATIPFAPGATDVPQGLGYDAEHGEFVYTFYDSADQHVGALVFADETGAASARVALTGLHHYGGVTLMDGRTYVCGGGKVQVHDTAVARAGRSQPLMTVPVRASSTMTSHAGSLHVAAFRRDRPGRMYRYDVAADGAPVETGESWTVPPCTQGVAFADDGSVFFSRSWGRSRPSTLTRVAADDLRRDGGWTLRNGTDTALPPMAEGAVIVDGRLHQLYESGAFPYHRHQRAHLLSTLVLGPVRPRDRLTVHEVDQHRA